MMQKKVVEEWNGMEAPGRGMGRGGRGHNDTCSRPSISRYSPSPIRADPHPPYRYAQNVPEITP